MATSLRLEAELEQRLDALAKATGRTKAFYLREIIRRGLDDVEDAYMADAAVERLRRGESRTRTSAEVRHELGLDH